MSELPKAMGFNTLYDEAMSTPERRAHWFQEANILEVIEAICRAMERMKVSRKELARRLGKNAAYVTRLLDGQFTLPIRELSDVFTALGVRMQVGFRKIEDPRRESDRLKLG